MPPKPIASTGGFIDVGLTLWQIDGNSAGCTQSVRVGPGNDFEMNGCHTKCRMQNGASFLAPSDLKTHATRGHAGKAGVLRD